jgi:multisite-specific tRNA:(cytosine-C5)-methyltransferase
MNRDPEDHSLGNGVKGPIMDIPVSALEEDEVHEDEEVTDRIAAIVEEEEVEEEGEGVATTANQRVTDGRFQRQGRWRGVDPVLFLEDEKVIGSLVAFYGIKETFPLSGHLVTRSEDSSRLKRIYYVSKSVSDVIRLNFSAGEHLKMTSAGLKMFVSTPESLPLWILYSMGGCGSSLALERAPLSKE